MVNLELQELQNLIHRWSLIEGKAIEDRHSSPTGFHNTHSHEDEEMLRGCFDGEVNCFCESSNRKAATFLKFPEEEQPPFICQGFELPRE